VKARAIEFDTRQDTIKLTDKELNKVKDGMKKMKETMDWLPKEELDAAMKKVEDFEAEWKSLKEEQEKKPGYEEPLFTKTGVDKMMSKAFADVKKLSKMKKPKERKKPKEPKAKKDKKGAKKGEAPSARTPKELGELIEKTQNEVDKIKNEKMEAVATEDYEKADKLKESEEKLLAELGALKKEMEVAVAKMGKDAASDAKKEGGEEKKSEEKTEEKKEEAKEGSEEKKEEETKSEEPEKKEL